MIQRRTNRLSVCFSPIQWQNFPANLFKFMENTGGSPTIKEVNLLRIVIQILPLTMTSFPSMHFSLFEEFPTNCIALHRHTIKINPSRNRSMKPERSTLHKCIHSEQVKTVSVSLKSETVFQSKSFPLIWYADSCESCTNNCESRMEFPIDCLRHRQF